jgi:hypothetical protein
MDRCAVETNGFSPERNFVYFGLGAGSRTKVKGLIQNESVLVNLGSQLGWKK